MQNGPTACEMEENWLLAQVTIPSFLPLNSTNSVFLSNTDTILCHRSLYISPPPHRFPLQLKNSYPNPPILPPSKLYYSQRNHLPPLSGLSENRTWTSLCGQPLLTRRSTREQASALHYIFRVTLYKSGVYYYDYDTYSTIKLGCKS